MSTPVDSTAPSAGKRRWWWLRMAAASGLLVAGLLAAAFTAPIAYQRYRAWRYPPVPFMRIYDVQDMTEPAPPICTGPFLGKGPTPPLRRLGLAPRLWSPGPPGSTAELVDEIRTLIGEDAWSAEKTIEERSSLLVIVQTPAVHEKIMKHLEDLRFGACYGVEMEARLMTAADFPGLMKRLGLRAGQEFTDKQAAALTAAVKENGGRITRFPDSVFRSRVTGHVSQRKKRSYLCYYSDDGTAGRQQFYTGFDMQVFATVPRDQLAARMHLRPAYCELLATDKKETPGGKVEVPVVDERRGDTVITLSHEGWTALLLEPKTRDKRVAGPVLVLIGVQIVPAPPSTAERKL